MISVQGLRKRFGAVQAVAGVDLKVDRGEILLLLGQNGAGKSTTLRCLGGILRPDSGEIRFDDLRVPDDIDSIRRSLGVVPDQARLYGRNTAFEYLDHFGRVYGLPEIARRRRIRELLERFELEDAAGRVLYTYSRGMAQKVALIRATLHEPRWLFCDEPTVGLDPVAAADMRRYLEEQRDRGAAVIVTTHQLAEAELLADRIAIMRGGHVVAAGSLPELRRWAGSERRFTARLPGGRTVSYTAGWQVADEELARRAAELQGRLAAEGTPYLELREEAQGLEAVYLKAMDEPEAPASEPSAPALIPGIRPRRMFASLAGQGRRLREFLPFYVASWWRRGDLSWVIYLNAFVLLLVAVVALFGSIPAVVGAFAGRAAGSGVSVAGLLLPLFFMSFALLESIKSSIGIWWEKAQQSLEVLLYTPLDDPSLVWLEVLPGVAVSSVYVTAWMAAGMGLMALFGRPAPWDLLPVFALVAAATAYWAAMGRMLGFMLFPREGAAGGAWSFLLSPISAAVADIPLALFVFRSPLAPASLALPFAACLVLTVITGATFDRERLLESGAGRERPRRRWLPTAALRRHAAALALGLVLAAVPAGTGAVLAAGTHAHSWAEVTAVAHGSQPSDPAAPGSRSFQLEVPSSTVTVASSLLAGVVATFGLMLVLLAVTFAAFFLLGLPELLLLPVLAGLWGVQVSFGPTAPLQDWLGLGAGLALLALTVNTAAGIPLYTALAFGAGSRVDRLRTAWTDYFALYRGLVIPACAGFGVVVAALLLFTR